MTRWCLVFIALVSAGAVGGTAPAAPVSRTLRVTQPYLHLPVAAGAAKRRVVLEVGGQVVSEFEAELTDGPGQNLMPVDVRGFVGQELTLRANGGSLAGVTAADAPPPDRPDAEARRPLIHFTARRGWLNDPNGMVYYAGEYHLFFQHNPYGTAWGNMHWGHAVSTDLVHWRELPLALSPKKWDDFAFSGSAVVDTANTSGFGTAAAPPLVTAFTSTGRGECITYSIDRGRTWVEYDRNPVVKHAGRDPKLVWHAPTKRWVMAVYDEKAGGQDKGVSFYTSPDLKAWAFASRTGDFYECPDLVELPIQGSPGMTRWVLYGADGRYLLGTFDGKSFTPDGPKQTLWRGSFYAAQTFANAPDGRCVQIGWARGIDTPTLSFNQQMTIPVDLTLRRTPAGLRLVAEPVPELAKACGPAVTRQKVPLGAEPALLADVPAAADIRIEMDLGTAATVRLKVRGVDLRYEVEAERLTWGQMAASARADGGRLTLRIVTDRQSVEVFTPDGTALSLAAPVDAKGGMTAVAEGGAATVEKLEVARFAGK